MPEHHNAFFSDFIAFNDNHASVELLQPSYYQLGFICSVQALPELVDLEQWLPYLWQDQSDISFENEQQATEYAQKVLTLVANIKGLYEQGLPLNDLNTLQWLDDQQQLHLDAVQFSAGFLAAIALFNAHWVALESDENTQNILQTTILLLTKLAPPEEVDQQMLDLFQQLPEFAEIVQILPQLLSNLALSAAQHVQSHDSL